MLRLVYRIGNVSRFGTSGHVQELCIGCLLPRSFFFFFGGGGGGGSSTDISNCQRLVGMAQDWSPMPGSLFLPDLVVISHGPGSVGSVISWGYEVYRYFGTFSRSMLSMFVSFPQGRLSLAIIKHNISLGFHHHKKNGWPNFDDWNP